MTSLDAYTSGTVYTAATQTGTLVNNYAYRRGNVVSVSARQYGTINVTTSAKIFGIPEGFRPSSSRWCIGYFFVIEDNIWVASLWSIDTSGGVTLSYSSGKHTNNFGFAATYVI